MISSTQISNHNDRKGTFIVISVGLYPGSWKVTSLTFRMVNVTTHHVKHEINCETAGIIYLRTCKCGAFYVGKTRGQLKKRIYDHIL